MRARRQLHCHSHQSPVKNAAFGARGGGAFGSTSRALLRGDRSVAGGGADRHDEDTPKGGEPGEEPAEVVAGGGENGVGGVALGSGEIVSAHAVLGLGVADDRFDRRAAAEFAVDGLGDAAPLLGALLLKG